MFQFERNMKFSSTYLNTFSKSRKQEMFVCPDKDPKNDEKKINELVKKEATNIFNMTKSQLEEEVSSP